MIVLKKVTNNELNYLYNSLVKSLVKYTKPLPDLDDKLKQSIISDIIEKDFHSRIVRASTKSNIKLPFYKGVILAQSVVDNNEQSTRHYHEKYKLLLLPQLL